jgi:hypothetical protein
VSMRMSYPVKTSVRDIALLMLLVYLERSTVAFVDSSEYLADCDKRRAFISGFNGSAGV